jgi:hypothetical protein
VTPAASDRFRVTSLALTAIYAPYLLLFLARGALENAKSLLAVWPIFPGLALSQLIPPYGFLNQLRGFAATFLFTLLFAAVSILAALRFRRALWRALSGVAVASSALVYVMLLLLRA